MNKKLKVFHTNISNYDDLNIDRFCLDFPKGVKERAAQPTC